MTNTPETDANEIGHAHKVVPSDLARNLERQRNALKEAALAVVNRWETPNWKDAPSTAEYINRLRAALYPTNARAMTPGKNEKPLE